MFENPETAKYVLKVFLSTNDQMEESAYTISNNCSPQESKEFKNAVGHLLSEIFDRIIVPISKRHPSLKPPGHGNLEITTARRSALIRGAASQRLC